MAKPVPKDCRKCPKFYTWGVKDGKHDRWCSKYGKPAPDAIGRCRLEKSA